MLRRFTGRMIVSALVLVGAVGGAASLAADEPPDLVKYRKAFMDANGAHLGMIAAIVKGQVSLTDELVPQANALAEQGKLATANLKQLFPEGSGKDAGLDTAALPVIWEKWSEFEAAAQRFAEESAKLVEVAQSGDMTAVGQQLGALGKNACGSCHETFREKK
jgi:cytochrome c556